MISALTAAIDAKDHYTFDHSKNVARYAASLAVGVGLNDEQVRTIYAAGLLHDIGKISIPEEILRKTGKLTDSEYDVMKSHVNSSIEMIRHLPDMDYLIPAVLGTGCVTFLLTDVLLRRFAILWRRKLRGRWMRGG